MMKVNAVISTFHTCANKGDDRFQFEVALGNEMDLNAAFEGKYHTREVFQHEFQGIDLKMKTYQDQSYLQQYPFGLLQAEQYEALALQYWIGNTLLQPFVTT